MRETYKTIKGDAGVDFAHMARQLAAELKVGIHVSSPVYCCTTATDDSTIIIIKDTWFRLHSFVNNYTCNSLPDITKFCVRLRNVVG